MDYHFSSTLGIYWQSDMHGFTELIVGQMMLENQKAGPSTSYGIYLGNVYYIMQCDFRGVENC